MFGRRKWRSEMKAAKAAERAATARQIRAQAAKLETERIADEARPLQRAIRAQYEQNHWSELIFGRLG